MGNNNFSNEIFDFAGLATIIKTSDFDHLFQNGLTYLKSVVPFSKSLICVKYDENSKYVTVNFDSNDIEDENYIKKFNDKFAQDIVYKYFNNSGSTVVRQSDEISKDMLDRSKYKQEFLDGLHLYNAAYMIIYYGGINYGAILLYREEGEPDFSDNDIKFLKSISKQFGLRLSELLIHPSGDFS